MNIVENTCVHLICDFVYLLKREGRLFISFGNEEGYVEEVYPHTEGEYPYWPISINGEIHKYSCHRLIAKYFVPNPYNQPVVNHKDGNKLNFHADNLEWVSQSENIKHAIRNNLCPFVDIEKVRLCCSLIANGCTNKEISEELNMTQQWVCNIRNKRRHEQISKEYF